MLSVAATIPYKILSWYQQEYVDNMAKLVIYELCSKNCFGLKKAAFLVNNPDFKWCRGVVGYEAREDSLIVKNEADVINFFEQSLFHATTCAIECVACEKNDSTVFAKIAEHLHMPSHQVCTIPLKHGNEGLFVYEFFNTSDELSVDIIQQIVALIGFCPLA
jgi:hypothetical protein